MFLAAPTSTGVRVRTLPVATLLLAVALSACAAWTLPGRAALREARRDVETALADSRANATAGSLRHRQVPTVMVNGRLSSRSFARQHIVGLISFYRSVPRSLTLCLMQSERDVQRIVALGADADRVHRTGNIKFDQPMPCDGGRYVVAY